MATNSTRNLSFEQAQAMWPGITFSEGETFTVSSQEPISEFIRCNPPSDFTMEWHTAQIDSPTPPPGFIRKESHLPEAGARNLSDEQIQNAVKAMANPRRITDGQAKAVELAKKYNAGPSIVEKIMHKVLKEDKMRTEAVKADSGKPDWSLVPFEALEGMVRVLEFGANKYSRNNWMTGGGFSYRRVLTACMRHLFSYMGGEDKDPESGLSHIHHAQCNLLFIAMYLTNKEKFNKDDRESR